MKWRNDIATVTMKQRCQRHCNDDYRWSGRSTAIRDNPSKQHVVAPDTTTHSRQLHHLRVIDKDIDLGPVVGNVVLKDRGIRSWRSDRIRSTTGSTVTTVTTTLTFKHDLFVWQVRRNGGNHIAAIGLDVLRDPFALNHDCICAGIQKQLRPIH